MRNVCTEAGMMAIRGDRDYVVEEDFMKVRTTPTLAYFPLLLWAWFAAPIYPPPT
jgi:hypothetical protein